MLLSTILIYIVDLLGDSKILLELFTRKILEVAPEMRYWVLYGDDPEEDQYMFMVPSDKSFKYKTNINSKVIQQFSASILLHLVDKVLV
jgi:hypothetical protein